MNRKVWTVCPSCSKSVRIPFGKVSTCPQCGAEILPCEQCGSDCSDCPYEKRAKGRGA